jgi:para-nitrobenzyl esterase
MIGYWTAFTRTGDPNAATLPKWPRYTAAGEEMMSPKEGGSKAESDFAVTHQCRFWAPLGN